MGGARYLPRKSLRSKATRERRCLLSLDPTCRCWGWGTRAVSGWASPQPSSTQDQTPAQSPMPSVSATPPGSPPGSSLQNWWDKVARTSLCPSPGTQYNAGARVHGEGGPRAPGTVYPHPCSLRVSRPAVLGKGTQISRDKNCFVCPLPGRGRIWPPGHTGTRKTRMHLEGM